MRGDRLETLVLRAAEARPGATAVVDPAGSLTYEELLRDARRLAGRLREAGCTPGERVALLAPKSKEALVSMLATLFAGCSYVPMDPASPPARAARILRSCEPRVLLLGGSIGRGEVLEAAGLPERPVLGWIGPGEPPEGERLSFRLAELAGWPELALGENGDDGQAAHILFTSGSTGEPKGVVVSHASVRHFVEWANGYFGVQPGDRNSGHSPLFFDLSTYDIFGTFAAGAELHLVPPERSILPARLADFIRDHRLTQWFSVPSLLHYMARLDAVPAGGFPDLKRVLWCGEVFPTPALIHWMERLPGVTFTNLYGPTEATIASSYHTLPAIPRDGREEVPIGRACRGEELLVLDEERRPVAAGTSGDLYIAGVGLSAGYWRDDEKTAAAFFQHADPRGSRRIYRTGDVARQDESGITYYLGRSDSQVKSRGYRIELLEIEAALHAVPGLRDAAVVALPTDGFEGVRLCCAFVPERAGTAPPERIRAALREQIPNYMMPSRWRELTELPRTANGKVDRRALREQFAGNATPDVGTGQG